MTRDTKELERVSVTFMEENEICVWTPTFEELFNALKQADTRQVCSIVKDIAYKLDYATQFDLNEILRKHMSNYNIICEEAYSTVASPIGR